MLGWLAAVVTLQVCVQTDREQRKAGRPSSSSDCCGLDDVYASSLVRRRARTSQVRSSHRRVVSMRLSYTAVRKCSAVQASSVRLAIGQLRQVRERETRTRRGQAKRETEKEAHAQRPHWRPQLLSSTPLSPSHASCGCPRQTGYRKTRPDMTAQTGPPSLSSLFSSLLLSSSAGKNKGVAQEERGTEEDGNQKACFLRRHHILIRAWHSLPFLFSFSPFVSATTTLLNHQPSPHVLFCSTFFPSTLPFLHSFVHLFIHSRLQL